MITAQDIRLHFDYDPPTGNFTRRTGNRRWAVGSQPGWVGLNGYRYLSIRGDQMLDHRAAFLWMLGRLPKGVVDHIDGNPLNNAWSNLRATDHSVNGQNQKRASVRSKSGVLGVHRHHKNHCWISQITIRGKRIHIGSFDDLSSAQAAYIAAKREFHPGWVP